MNKGLRTSLRRAFIREYGTTEFVMYVVFAKRFTASPIGNIPKMIANTGYRQNTVNTMLTALSNEPTYDSWNSFMEANNLTSAQMMALFSNVRLRDYVRRNMV